MAERNHEAREACPERESRVFFRDAVVPCSILARRRCLLPWLPP